MQAAITPGGFMNANGASNMTNSLAAALRGGGTNTGTGGASGVG